MNYKYWGILVVRRAKMRGCLIGIETICPRVTKNICTLWIDGLE